MDEWELQQYMELIERCCLAALEQPHHTGFIGGIISAIKAENPYIIYPRNRINYHVKICLGCLKVGDPFSLDHGTVRERIDLTGQRRVKNTNDIDVDSLLAEIRSIPRVR